MARRKRVFIKRYVVQIGSVGVLVCAILQVFSVVGQDIGRQRPEGWEQLVEGGRFMDLFRPIPLQGPLTVHTWGADAVRPRSVYNGLEDDEYSYWGGNMMMDEAGRYHLYVCRWPEGDPKGHMAWPKAEVVHALSDHSLGPFEVKDRIGKGYNPEIQQLADGRYMLYVHAGYYLSDDLDGPWDYHDFEYDQRQRPVMDHMSNLTFARREDGSFLMVCRGGGVWFSQSGLPPYQQVSTASIYPPYDGNYEDPVIWRDHVQYHLIVNDWLGRVAYYMRSKDGICWKMDGGEAYRPGIARYEDGTLVDWYKFERIKVLQDKFGRAIQANFAVGDTLKHHDLGYDKYSAKNIGIPLTVGRLMTILDTIKIEKATRQISILIRAEEGFDPHEDLDVNSLRFGAAEVVNRGGGCRVVRSKRSGQDLILTFKANAHGLTDDHFAAKLLGRDKEGELLFAYARLPWVDYYEPVLSAQYPELSLDGNKLKVAVEVQNFGQVSSGQASLEVFYKVEDKWKSLSKAIVPVLMPFEKRTVTTFARKFEERDVKVQLKVAIHQLDQEYEVLEGSVVIR
ncbi:glycoside hydrolase family protein [Reichenbachiella agariperforans]|uniref:glycoside hydrolase family protein n=1 Tax=Reichenbachiella agariperforans TaxID=156994 RepID=UPI001C09338B|nr:glycoside hydrolase family protein [Reichenbachiella agariperforans]MBU2912623.1 glycoside hydrolase family protein [Reichenbachiella agariperforans]